MAEAVIANGFSSGGRSARSAPLGYSEWAPPAGLEWAIECVWTRRTGGGPAHRSRVLPDGCADLIFDVSPECGLTGGGVHGLRAIAVGTMTKPLDTELAPRSTLIGIRFHPGAGYPFLGAPLEELVDRRVGLTELWPRAAVERLLGRLAESERPAQWSSALVAELSPRRSCIPDQAVRQAVRWILESQGRVRAGELALRLGISRQTLARRFRRQVGVGPKMLARVVRLRATVERIDRAGPIDWAELALEQGFSDQAHLCAELRELAGEPPTRLLAKRRSP
ncbi:MAG TPA: AraC family transcriptional regulator [Thermoanaerobaculia bacterium]|nr:AraC family transcriptional regulator [Thermoanaerobaculia bacterium]